jgi:hypothetical protein
MINLVREHRAGKLELFAPPCKPGPPPGTVPARDRVRGRVIGVRRHGLSAYEISARLSAQGTRLNRASVTRPHLWLTSENISSDHRISETRPSYPEAESPRPQRKGQFLLRGDAGLPACGAGPVSRERPAVPAGPLESDPGGFVPGAVRLAVLADVLDGVEMGAWDLRVVRWLAGLDTSTALTIASWIARAREAGRGR